MEEFRPITGYEGLYEISPSGIVRSCVRLIARKAGATSLMAAKVIEGRDVNGRVVLIRDGKQKRFDPQRLAADVWSTAVARPGEQVMTWMELRRLQQS